MNKKNILLICGGGNSEHDVSLKSSKYIHDCLNEIPEFNTYWVEIGKDGIRRNQNGVECELRKNGVLVIKSDLIKLDFAIPCIHGYPGETGDIQSLFEMMQLPYLGCSPEASTLCFNKISTKLWLNALNIPNTPFEIITNENENEINKALKFQENWETVFIKAASQGSSIGCYRSSNSLETKKFIKEAFKYSNLVLIEKEMVGRELEVAAYEYNGKLKTSQPGEIVCPEGVFYTFQEKYDPESNTNINIIAPDLDSNIKEEIRNISIKAFKGLKLRHLARIDFFLTKSNEIYLNEINTFPGMTPISMFPKMIEENKDSFKTFIVEIIKSASKNTL